MQRESIMILDGYNIIHLVPELEHAVTRSLEAARRMLLAYCREWLIRRRDVAQFFVVFDGDSAVIPAGYGGVIRGLRQIYTRTHETADTRIVALLEEAPGQRDYTVVSDDGEVAREAKSRGARVLSPDAFYAVMRERPTPADRYGHKRRPDPVKKDLPTEARERITRDLMREWGVD